MQSDVCIISFRNTFRGKRRKKNTESPAKQQVGIHDPRRDASRLSRLDRSQFALLPIRAQEKSGENTTPVTVKYNLTFVIAQPLHAV